jgi:hypothetical protein
MTHQRLRSWFRSGAIRKTTIILPARYMPPANSQKRISLTQPPSLLPDALVAPARLGVLVAENENQKEDTHMNDSLDSAELVAQWRDHDDQDNPAGPLYAAGEFAEADIVNATSKAWTCGTYCTGSVRVQCC